MIERSEVGDLVGLPVWLPRLPMRVLGVEPLLIAGWVRLRGYLIADDLSQRHVTYLVPVRRVRRLPDPARGRPRAGDG